jgi:hypothetical protein
MQHKYRCIDYFDVWRDIDGGWTVNDLAVVENDVIIDVDRCSERELYQLFARIAGYKPALRAIEVIHNDDYFIEFIYTAQRLGGFYPLGRFEIEPSELKGDL